MTCMAATFFGTLGIIFFSFSLGAEVFLSYLTHNIIKPNPKNIFFPQFNPCN